VRKFLVPAVTLLMLAAACGGGKKESSLTNNQGASASPGAAASSQPGKAAGSAKPGAKTSAGATASKPAAGATQSGGATTKVVAGGYPPPKDGSYVYRADGSSTNPFSPPNSPPQKFSNETVTQKVSHSGNVVTTEQTTSMSAGTSTQKTRWEADRVLLLSVNTSTPQGDYGCTFNPPLLITKFPVKPGTIPTQKFKGSGNACSGSLDITIVKREATTDANGKSWDTWRVQVKTTANAGQFTQSSNETRWVAPAISSEIRSTGNSDVKITGAGGSQTAHQTLTIALKSYPK
jgi:hypothetical protein